MRTYYFFEQSDLIILSIMQPIVINRQGNDIFITVTFQWSHLYVDISFIYANE